MTSLSRRSFVQLSAAATGALALGVDLSDAGAASDFSPSAWLTVASSGEVTVGATMPAAWRMR